MATSLEKSVELFKQAFYPDQTNDHRRNLCRKALAEAITHSGIDIPILWDQGNWKDHLSKPRMTQRGIASLFGKPHSMLVSALSIYRASNRFGSMGINITKAELWQFAMLYRGDCRVSSRGPVFGMHKEWDDEYLAQVVQCAEELGIDASAGTNFNATTASKPKSTRKKPAAGVEAALNGLLGTVGLPDYSDLSKTLDDLVVLKGDLRDKEGAIEELKRKLAAASKASAMAPIAVSGSGEVPDGKVEISKAYDLFNVSESEKSMFDFDLPHGVWDDKHPHVPAVDESYVFDPETLIPMLLSVVNNRIPWIKGHTGTGKTTLVEQVYARLNLPLFRLNLDSDITRGELVGREVIRTDSDGKTVTEFVDGIIPMSMKQPCGLLLDEVDAARPDMGFVLQRLLEGKGFMLLEDGGRTIVPNPYFRMFATANTNGRGDETGLYSGTRALGTAFVNRFKPYLEVDYMTEEEEATLLSEKNPTLDKSDCASIARYATEHRTAFKQSDVTLACSPRDTLSFAASAVDYKQAYGSGSGWMMLAFRHSILNAADSDDRQVLDGLANRVFGGAQ